MKVCAIRDSKAEFYLKPFVNRTTAEAEREFKMAVNDSRQGNIINASPDDCDLFELGDWDEITGMFKPLAAPKHIVKAAQLVDVRPELGKSR